jgi:hypothetical protein
MSQLVNKDRDEKKHSRDCPHYPILVSCILLMGQREIALNVGVGHRKGVDHEEEDDKPGIVDYYLDPADATQTKTAELHMLYIYIMKRPEWLCNTDGFPFPVPRTEC